MKKKLVAIVCLIALMISMTTLSTLPAAAEEESPWIKREPVKNADYSFAVLGDIQSIVYKDNRENTRNLSQIISWILNNKESRKIEYVFELGDTVDTLTTYPPSYNPAVANPAEWTIAYFQIRRLNGKVPYSVVRGNHDDEAGYHRYICTDEYKSQMDEFFYDETKPATLGNSMSNSYRKIEIGNHKYLMLNLDYNVKAETKEWANKVISENPDYKVIVSIHAYLSSNGSFYIGGIGSPDVKNSYTQEIGFNGKSLWDDIFSKHSNMFMILSGHVSVDDPVMNTRKGANGNEVIEFLVDPQGYDSRDPSGFIFMLNFMEGGSKIEVEYFSPSKKDMYFKEKNQFSISLPEGTLPKYVPTAAITEATTTEATTTEATTTAAPAEEEKSGCGSAIGSTLMIACVTGTSLATFAMRKKKED